jgi:hypothetical protein
MVAGSVMTDSLLSLQQAARFLGYSAGGLRKLVRRRELQYFQVRKHSPLRFRQEWLDAFVAEHSVGTGLPVPETRKKKPPKVGGLWAREMSL